MSFRTRLFAISIMTVSAVLAIVITLSWSRIMRVEVEHLDNRLCMEAKRLIPSRPEREGVNELIQDLADKLRIDALEQSFFLVRRGDGIEVLQSNNRIDQGFVDALVWGEKSESSQECQLASFNHKGSTWRASLVTVPGAQSAVGVEVNATISELQETLRSTMIVVIPLSLLLSLFGAWFIATNAIRPLNRLNTSMQAVTQKELDQRLSTHNEDSEFRLLIESYNGMLDRLERSFYQTSRFTADAAHELKTPLTILRGKLEQAVVHEDASLLDLNDILDEVGHLSAITRKLLLLTQADAGAMALHLEPISITDTLDELTADLELVADNIELDCNIERNLTIVADTVLLHQLLNNLLSNAMRYALPEAGITVFAYQKSAQIELLISNHSKPIPCVVREKLFERFYRGEPEHTQGISGSGLGLSLAREIARAHGGELVLEPSAENIVIFKLTLPHAS